MRILFLSTWFPYPPDNGSKLRVYHLLCALAQDHAVTLVSFAFDTARPDAPGNLCDLCAAIQVVQVNPFEMNRAGAPRTFLSVTPMASRPIPAMRQLVADVLRSDAFDAVIASTAMMADYVLLAQAGTAKILEEHNSLTRWMRERYEDASTPLYRARCWASWQKTQRYEAGLFNRFDLVTMVSEQDRAVTVATVGEHGLRVEVVSNGVDCIHNQPGLGVTQSCRLVFNGSITYSANYDAMHWFLAEIYPRIKAHVLGISLTITGSTRDVDLAGLALNDTVRLTGFVDDVRKPVSEATACIAPIRQGGGTRLKILEAMALGTPVVATSKGAEGLDFIDGEHLLLADDAETFAARTVELLRNTDLRHHLVSNARRLVETRYDWEQIGRRFVALVEETVTSTRMRAGRQ